MNFHGGHEGMDPLISFLDCVGAWLQNLELELRVTLSLDCIISLVQRSHVLQQFCFFVFTSNRDINKSIRCSQVHMSIQEKHVSHSTNKTHVDGTEQRDHIECNEEL
jgi:hypothetical protein